MKSRKLGQRRWEQESFFSCAFLVLLLIRFAFHNSYIELPDIAVTCSTLLSGILYLLVLVRKRDPLGEFFVHIPYLLVGALSYLVTGASAFLIVILAVLVLKDMEKETILKYYIVIRFLTISLILVAAFTGAIPNANMVVHKSGVYVPSLLACGYSHPNQFAQSAGAFLIACICIANRKYIVWKLAGIAALSAGVYYVTRSRSMILIVAFMLVCKILLEFKKPEKMIRDIWSKCVWLPYALVVLLGIGGPFLMNRFFLAQSSGILQRFLYQLDYIFSGRYTFAAAVMRTYPLHPFGNVFDFSALESMFGGYAVDNGYVNFLYNFGIVPFLVFLYLSYSTVKRMLEQDQMVYALCAAAMLLWGLFENMLTLPTIDFALLFYGMGTGRIADWLTRIERRRKRKS